MNLSPPPEPEPPAKPNAPGGIFQINPREQSFSQIQQQIESRLITPDLMAYDEAAETVDQMYADLVRTVRSRAAEQEAKDREAEHLAATEKGGTLIMQEDERIASAVVNLPRRVQVAIKEIVDDDTLNDGVEAMMERASSFSTPLAALFAGIAMFPASKKRLDETIDAWWKDDSERSIGLGPGSKLSDEVVVGGGLHAAIYCAVRVARGHPMPLVIEQHPRAGGAFAVSENPSFYLNSRNRPGDLSLPGSEGALNVLPGAVVQPADLSVEEYQTNSALAWAIRCTLACYGRVITGRKVARIDPIISRGAGQRRVMLTLDDGKTVTARRIVIATGLGSPKSSSIKNERIMTFPDFMKKMDETFPLRGMRRVAVLGAGDSGRTTIEALTGQGPQAGWSVASLDWPEVIDWYGVPQLTRPDWETCNRSRYKGIGRLLEPPRNRGMVRVRPFQEKGTVTGGFSQVYVSERPYDHVIECGGFKFDPITVMLNDGVQDPLSIDGRIVGRCIPGRDIRDESKPDGYDRAILVVGPAARIDIGSAEQAAIGKNIAENSTALFRYAERTATIAARM